MRDAELTEKITTVHQRSRGTYGAPTHPCRPDARGHRLRTPSGRMRLYPATVIDIASRRVVGWATAGHLRTELVADALTAACRTRRPAGPVIFHSDRGCSPP
ncbi:DDE-type integrase/transposase/recombinase [Streptomyces goshikiensis]|uniref:DDE-type integrase/transposase/recombinase n=1 Tax=Streptomyces goshikiensis TaxID=1942 RepID=UPI0039173185